MRNEEFWLKSVHELIEKINKASVDFSDKVWEDVSPQAKQLIKNLLIKNPEERWTAKEALSSDWINGIESIGLRSLTKSFENLSLNLKRLTKRKQYGNGISIVESSSSSSSYLVKSSGSFSTYDNYFWSSERKLDYSKIVFNDSEFEIDGLDEIKEETPNGLKKMVSILMNDRNLSNVPVKLSTMPSIQKEHSKTLEAINTTPEESKIE